MNIEEKIMDERSKEVKKVNKKFMSDTKSSEILIVSNTVGIGNNHTLDLVVRSRTTFEATKTAESFTTTRRLVGDHTTNSTFEHLRRSTLMITTTRRIGVHLLTHEGVTADEISHH